MATATEKSFHAALITPEALGIEAEVTAVQIPAHDGMVGLLTHRAPLLTKLGVGVLTLNTLGGTQQFLISGGYAQMKENVLTILTDEATPAAAITQEMVAAETAKLNASTGADNASLDKRQTSAARIAAMRQLLGMPRE